MARLYYNSIKREQINLVTGEVWKIEDVPELWRQRVEGMLNEEQTIL